MPPDQTPKLSLVGASNAAFIAQKPLMLGDAPKKGPGVAKNPEAICVPRRKKRRK